MIFRQLTSEEEEAGYSVICDAVTWMKGKGIDLWEEPLPREVYAKRHGRGENFALFVDGEIAAVMSLVSGIPGYWTEDVEDPKGIWLCTLATAKAYHGKEMGKAAMRKAEEYLAENGMSELYLDCAPGHLEVFYQGLGYQILKRAKTTMPHAEGGRTFDAVLMRKKLT